MGEEQTKRCAKCAAWKPMEDFYRQKSSKKDGRGSYCKGCNKATVLEWLHANPDRAKELWEKKRQRVPDDERKRRSRAMYWKHHDRVCAEGRRKGKRNATSLSDVYIRQVISQAIGLPRSVIAQPLVEAKRAHLQVHRLLRKEKMK